MAGMKGEGEGEGEKEQGKEKKAEEQSSPSSLSTTEILEKLRGSPSAAQQQQQHHQDGKQVETRSRSGSIPIHPQAPRSAESAMMDEASWIQQEKHIIILSDAGKPIYTRHGTEDMIVTRTGVIQALISFVEENFCTPSGKYGTAEFGSRRPTSQQERDELKWFKSGQFQYVFLVRKHIYLVLITKTDEPVRHLELQLKHVYNQLLSITTLSHIERAFQRWSNYDLRRHLAGMEKFTEHLIERLETDYSFFLNAFRCTALDQVLRDKVGAVLQTHKRQEVVFALVIANGRIVTIMRPKRFHLHSQDILLMLNVAQTPTRSFDAGETWMPLCLPNFNSSGFMHAHVTYLDDENHIYLLLLSNKQDAFYSLSECRQDIYQAMQSTRILASLIKATTSEALRVSSLKIPDLRHFIYKHIKAEQFMAPMLEAPYTAEEEERRLFRLYQRVETHMHAEQRPVKLFFQSCLQETVLGWTTAGFELYAVFDPLATKQSVTNSVLELLRWLKKNESRIFMLNPMII
eukprot:m.151403 g.151403  ORF g.151403 m.151403 type:complete len:518 (+) comp16199_c4_seq2:3057-4610(+)